MKAIHPVTFLCLSLAYANDLQWETCGPFALDRGTHTIRISSAEFMPHLAGLLISSQEKVKSKDAFADLFPGKKVLLTGPIQANTRTTREKLRRLLPGVREVLFVRRYTLQSSHYYTDFIDGCRHFGGNLCVLSLVDGSVRELAPELSHGIFGRCDLSYDAQTVVFGWKDNLNVGFRIWEVGIDGSGLRQLTFPPTDEAQRIQKYQLDLGPKWVYKHHTDERT